MVVITTGAVDPIDEQVRMGSMEWGELSWLAHSNTVAMHVRVLM